MLERRAVEFDKDRKDAIRRCRNTLRLKDKGDAWSRYVTLEGDAEYALGRGLFAPDDDRRELWQYSHRLFQQLLAGPASELHECKDFITRFPEVQIEADFIEPVRRTIAALEMFMRGSVPSLTDFPTRLCLIGLRTYLELPPRPDGEPVIRPLPVQTELDLAIEEQNDGDDPYDDEEPDTEEDDEDHDSIEDDSAVTPPPQQMMSF
jgi:hypothetical protein